MQKNPTTKGQKYSFLNEQYEVEYFFLQGKGELCEPLKENVKSYSKKELSKLFIQNTLGGVTPYRESILIN